jgi:hypothetical protein
MQRPVWKTVKICQPVCKTVKTRQPPQYFAYCDSFLWLDPRALFAFHTGSLATFTFHTGLCALFAFHTGLLTTLAFHTSRRTIVATRTHYWTESHLKKPKTFEFHGFLATCCNGTAMVNSPVIPDSELV